VKFLFIASFHIQVILSKTHNEAKILTAGNVKTEHFQLLEFAKPKNDYPQSEIL
jgi:hypothetical protein